MAKRKETSDEAVITASKKVKTVEKTKNFEKKAKNSLQDKKASPKTFQKKTSELSEKPEDWNKFKKEKKQLKLKRKQAKQGFDVIVQAKKIGEKLRCKNLKGGDAERTKLINELHGLLKNKDHYPKFVLAHDTSRVVQWLLKYSSEIVKEQISKELIPHTTDMIQSKYGVFCLKRLLKYGSSATKSGIVDKLYGNAVKFTSHTVSAPLFEFAFTTCASQKQKNHLIQEFFGDMYKNSKDDQIKHLSDVFNISPDLKTAALGATKANILRIINKNLMDSTLVQCVIYQFLSCCSDEDRNELIQLLIPHIVVISNSKEGARAAMQCIWHGSNKDRKLAMKTLKEHLIELSKHEHGHATIITLLDTADDTVLLHKIIISELLKQAKELAKDEWGRKVLMWLVAPADPKFFHPHFVKELQAGRDKSTSKKDIDTRRKEIRTHSLAPLLDLVASEPEFWLENSSIAFLALAIVRNEDAKLEPTLKKLASVIVDPEWKIKDGEKEIAGIEDAGMHLVLKKLAQNDKDLTGVTFGQCLCEVLDEELLKSWIKLNRACFLLIATFENNGKSVQTTLKTLLKRVEAGLKKQTTAGSRILLEKLNKK